MEGCLKRERRSVERDVAMAWRVANFVGAGSKLRNLDYYLQALKPQHESAPVLEAIAAFQSLASRGLVTIREVPKKGDESGR